MAELTFENGIVRSDGDVIGYAEKRSDGVFRYVDDSEWRSPTTGLGSCHEYAADELDQIAAKLRTLNGEPNTRSTDERVVEMIAELQDIGENWTDCDFGGSDMLRLVAKYKELFPACKPSEEEVNG